MRSKTDVMFLGMDRKKGGIVWAKLSEIACMEEMEGDEALVYISNVGYHIKHFSQVLQTINALNPNSMRKQHEYAEENVKESVPSDDDSDGGSKPGE